MVQLNENTSADLALSMLAMRQALVSGDFDAQASSAIANQYMSGICLKVLLDDERATDDEKEQTAICVNKLGNFASEFLEPPTDFDVNPMDPIVVGAFGKSPIPEAEISSAAANFDLVKKRVQEVIQKATVDLSLLEPTTDSDREDKTYSVGMLEITAMNLEAVGSNAGNLNSVSLTQNQALLHAGTNFALNVKNQLLLVH